MHKILMVTGKGGVGKSFIASLLASKMAQEGRKTLLVEMGPWSFLQKALDLPQRSSFFTPQKTQYGFDHAVWAGEDCLTDYVKFLIKVPWAAEAFLKNAWLRSLIKVAPGLREISFLGKLTSQVRKHGPPLNYEVIIVDAVSSGHFLNLVRTPKGLMEVTQIGPLREQSESIHQALNNKNVFHTLVVSNLETFSVQESLEMTAQMKGIMSSPFSFIANKIYPVPESNGNIEASIEAKKFISEQLEIKDFQKKQIEVLSAKAPLYQVEFLFHSLKDILKDDHRQLFKGL